MARFQARSSIRPVVRAGFELLLVGVAVGMIVWAMVATVAVAREAEQASDLSYHQTIRELSQMLQGFTPDSVARVTTATHDVLGVSAAIDTLSVTIDPLNEPAFAVGGFVREQITAFNDAAIRQTVLTSAMGHDGTQWRNPSVLRVIRSADGRSRLADRADGSPMAVRSPYAESKWRDVFTADASTAPSLVGYEGYLPLGNPGWSGMVRLNGRSCEVVAERGRALLYCGGSFASGVNRFYDLAVTPGGLNAAPSAETYRARSIWVNGSQTRREAKISPGSVVELARTGPFLWSGTNWGALATSQWINGRQRFEIHPAGTIGFFGRAGRSAHWPEGNTPLFLSLDGTLAADLDIAASEFFATHQDLVDLMSVVVVDLNTGQVRAIAEPARTNVDDPLIAFEPRLVGSVVKPMVAAAILDRHLEAANLRITYAGETVENVAGAQLQKPFDNDLNGCGSEIGFTDFLRCSSNQYAAELLVRSLRRDGFDPRREIGAQVGADILERSEIADGLAQVFDVDAFSGRTPGRTVPFWDVPTTDGLRRAPAVSDMSLLPYESRPWVIPLNRNATPVDWLARYAFGGWENRWTLLGIAQSYARIASGRPIDLSFLRDTVTDRSLSFPQSTVSALVHIRRALRQVGANGTAVPLNAVLQGSLGNGVTVYSKTGTLNESADGVAIKALAFAVGNPTDASPDARLMCGFAVVTYFDFDGARVRRSGATSLPSLHLEFSTRVLPAILQRHWRRLSGCATQIQP
jgi:hypothetical protein